MSRKAKELTALAVGRLRKPGLHAVGGVPGLYLQVLGDRRTGQATGARTWVLRYVSPTRVGPGGKADKLRRDLGLGAFSPTGLGLAMARAKAMEAREKIKRGIDPIDDARALRSAQKALAQQQIPFKEAVAGYIKAHKASWTQGNRQTWERTLKQYAIEPDAEHPERKRIGDLMVVDIGTSEVLSVLTPIWDEVPTAASNLRGRIESVLDWATAHGYREGPNPARWKGHLKNLLANPRAKEKEHHPALPVEQMGEFMRELRERTGVAFRALELAILCASRSGEILEADWTEFDLQAGTWTVPAAHMKAGKDHRVALSKAAVELLTQLPTRVGPVFPGKGKGGMLTHNALYRALAQMNNPGVPWKDRDGAAVTVHGFRASFRTWGAERTNFPREVIEQCLAHTVAGAVELAYLRSDGLEKRRKVMDAWAGFCARLEGKSNVLALAAK